MDNRLRQLLDVVWGSRNEIRVRVPAVTGAEIIEDDHVWKELANVIYEKYHHKGQIKKGQQINEEKYEEHLDKLKNEAIKKEIYYNKEGSDHQFQNVGKGGGPANAQFRAYINICSGNVLQIASYLLEMIVDKQDWRGVQQFKFGAMLPDSLLKFTINAERNFCQKYWNSSIIFTPPLLMTSGLQVQRRQPKGGPERLPQAMPATAPLVMPAEGGA